MNVVSQECGLNASKHGVDDNTEWQQETCRSSRDTSQGSECSRSTSQQHGGNKPVSHQTKNSEDDMSSLAISCLDNLEESLLPLVRFEHIECAPYMSIWSSSLELDGDGSEKQNLDGSTAGVPERTTDSVTIRNRCRLKKSSSPSPRTDDRRGYKTRLDSSSGSTEHF